jgi:hypothetical protein
VLHKGKPPRRVDNVDMVIFSRGSLGCHQATSPSCRPTLRGLAANRYPQPISPKEHRKNPSCSSRSPRGEHNPPHKASPEPRTIFLQTLMEPQATKPSRRWQPPRVTSTTGLQHDHLVPLDATSRCNRTRITLTRNRFALLQAQVS